jgi:hypothetical protein
MCSLEEWLGFFPFGALSRLWQLLTGRSMETGLVPVLWELRG